MPSTLVAVAAQAARSSAENARDSPEGLRPTAKIVAVCAKVDGIGLCATGSASSCGPDCPIAVSTSLNEHWQSQGHPKRTSYFHTVPKCGTYQVGHVKLARPAMPAYGA